MTEHEMARWHDQLNGHEFEQTPGDCEGQGSLMCCSSLSHRVKHDFSSVTQSCLTLCNLMDCSTPGFLVHHQLPELTQTHVH